MSASYPMQLGELEKLVLNYLWREKEADAKQAYEHFSKSRGGTLNTIQSTLDRLYKKGLLSRTKVGHAFYYSPAVERKALISSLIQTITEELAKNDTDAVLAAFVDISDKLDKKSLQRLEDMISRKKAEKKPPTKTRGR